MSDRVGFGLVGYGAWGLCHAAAIEASAGARLVGVAARNPGSRDAALSAHPSAIVVGDYRELLERSDIDVVDIVIPSDQHARVASDCLVAGKHVLLEKPMALTLSDCLSLTEQAARSNRLLAIGHELRLSSLWGGVKQCLDDGVIGEPRYVLVELSRRPYRLGAGGWRYDPMRVGSWILEEPIHFFDLARWYLSSSGPPISLTASANGKGVGTAGLDDNFAAIVKFENGAMTVIAQTLAAFEHHQTVKVTGSKGAIWASWSGSMDRTRRATSVLRVFDGETVREAPLGTAAGELYELEQEIEMVASAVRHGTPVAASGIDGAWSVAMCLAAEESVRSGLPVAIPKVF